ncbi:MAG: hypothetical protein DRP87_14305 [Spirochaetes bacterium]|nr:MAG: hypothetical protein DRP87_14305 [Spirochaetota bacterium]
MTSHRVEQHRRFWQGVGASLLFIPRGDRKLFSTGEAALYGLDNYSERFEDPELMWEGMKIEQP